MTVISLGQSEVDGPEYSVVVTPRSVLRRQSSGGTEWCQAESVALVPDSVPRVAVCVPVRVGSPSIADLLVALSEQSWSGQPRVIVSIDGRDERIRLEAQGFGAEVVESADQRGSYAARNAAIEHVLNEVEILLFTDADCRPWPTWIEQHVAALEEANLTAGDIRVTMRPDPSPAEFYDRMRNLRQRTYAEHGWGATANLGMKAKVAARRFDGELRTGGDREFCLRVGQQGVSLTFVPAAGVDHPARRTNRAVLRKVLRRSAGILVAPVREGRRHVPRIAIRGDLVKAAREQGASRGVTWDLAILGLGVLDSGLIAGAAAVSRLRYEITTRVRS